MFEAKIELLSKVLREMESEIGTRDLAALVLKALKNSVKVLKTSGKESICKQFQNLTEVVASTEPKFGILNYHFAKLNVKLRNEICARNSSDLEIKKRICKEIDNILSEWKKSRHGLIENSEKLDIEGKTILIHDHSHTVQDVLAHCKGMGKSFKVIIAEQDFDKTHSNIERMHQAGIPFEVVPAYMLSHVHKEIDMLFFGALTLKDTMDFVMDPGTLGIISEFHVEKIPVFMFIDTSKFSLWKSKKRGDIFIRRDTRKHIGGHIEYERVKYSHDRVPADLFKKIVTDTGIYTPETLAKLFKERLEQFGEK